MNHYKRHYYPDADTIFSGPYQLFFSRMPEQQDLSKYRILSFDVSEACERRHERMNQTDAEGEKPKEQAEGNEWNE
jgi:hypothetical protein